MKWRKNVSRKTVPLVSKTVRLILERTRNTLEIFPSGLEKRTYCFEKLPIGFGVRHVAKASEAGRKKKAGTNKNSSPLSMYQLIYLLFDQLFYL